MEKKLESHINNSGEKVYTLDFVIDGQRRPPVLAKDPVTDPANADPDPDTDPPVSADNKNKQGGSTAPSATMVDGMVVDSWRLISCGQFWPCMGFFMPPQMVDYGHDGGRVLKQAVAMINAKKIDLMWNHSDDAKDVAGHVEGATWENSSDIPPGINANLVVDPQFDAKAARGLMTGELRNGSIGVSMQCVPSHPKMPEEEFYTKQGKTIDGEVVRWLPKKMKDVRHMAMVAAGTGADPDAGKRNVGADNKGTSQNFKQEKAMEKFAALLQSVLEKLSIDAIVDASIELPETVGERVNAKLELLISADRRYNELAEKVQAIGATLKVEGEENLSALATVERLPKVLALAEQGRRLVEFKVKETLDWFDKAHFSPDKKDPSETVKRQRARIEKLTDLDHLDDLAADYKDMAEKKFAAPRKSSQTPAPPADNDKGANYAYTPGEQDIRESAQKLLSSKKAKK
jgi:hypothetical protein